MLDDSSNIVLDTDGVGNALATILEDSKLQVMCLGICVLHQVVFLRRCRSSCSLCRLTKTSLSTLSVTVPHMQPSLQNRCVGCYVSSPNPNAGILTAGARDNWAQCRERLCSLAPSNAQVRHCNRIPVMQLLTHLLLGHQYYRQRALRRLPRQLVSRYRRKHCFQLLARQQHSERSRAEWLLHQQMV